MADSNPLPTRLKRARLASKLSQKELGIQIGLDESSASGRMNHYEKGRHLPDISILKRIAQKLNVPLNYFFCESEEMAELVKLINGLDTDEQKKLIEELKRSSSPAMKKEQ